MRSTSSQSVLRHEAGDSSTDLSFESGQDFGKENKEKDAEELLGFLERKREAEPRI